MFTSQLALLLVAASAVMAAPRPQNTENVPACVTLCVRVKFEEAASLAPNCPVTDVGCLCAQPSWIGAYSRCLQDNCRGGDVQTGATFGLELCANAGVGLNGQTAVTNAEASSTAAAAVSSAIAQAESSAASVTSSIASEASSMTSALAESASSVASEASASAASVASEASRSAESASESLLASSTSAIASSISQATQAASQSVESLRSQLESSISAASEAAQPTQSSSANKLHLAGLSAVFAGGLALLF